MHSFWISCPEILTCQVSAWGRNQTSVCSCMTRFESHCSDSAQDLDMHLRYKLSVHTVERKRPSFNLQGLGEIEEDQLPGKDSAPRGQVGLLLRI